MKKIEHQIFLKNNKLDKKIILQPIQEKIVIFDRMYALLETVSDCEKGDLLEQLEELDLEIVEDIDEEYADKLAFNDIEDEQDEQSVTEKIVPKKESTKLTTDETIIDKLFKMGRTQNIGRSTFKDLGMKTQLGWDTVIGKYRVTRTSVFRYRYSVKRI